MNSHEMIPFEKNRYYYGKMLTAADFRAEQDYVDKKQMFLNTVTFGAGILCGLSVERLDDKSVHIDSGAAIDGNGRSIVSDRACVKQLDTVKGYETLTKDKAVLCLAYREKEVQEVRVIGQRADEDEYQCNRIQETCEWYVADWEEDSRTGTVPSFCTETTIVDQKDYRVRLFMPQTICKDRMTKLTLRIQKLTDEEKTLNLYGLLQLPEFTTEQGEKELDIRQEEVYLEEGEIRDVIYWLIPACDFVGRTQIFPKPETDRVIIGAENIRLRRRAGLQIKVTDRSPSEVVQDSAGRINLEECTKSEAEDVPVAVLYLEEKGGSRRIRRVGNAGVRRYIALPRQQEEKEQFLSYYREIPQISKNLAPMPQFEEKEDISGKRGHEDLLIRGGTMEIPLDIKMKKGKICYSEEIIHGLGAGNVYIDVGVRQDPDTVVYGDHLMFACDGMDMGIKTAVKVFQKRGSFQVAVSVSGEQNAVILPLYWVAVKIPERTKKLKTQVKKI